jgi:hypothetical protein
MAPMLYCSVNYAMNERWPAFANGEDSAACAARSSSPHCVAD